ncbi:PLDc N-terminal domain-containing protein [Natrinema sp. SYSU A 869]|uniref:PLDc N-terminal domain-containing protein n=1 Tax=Natrinema sp. SYSU A 869 TaxID=2871694 RepID=UPI001CA3EC0A|nr:PLDc N-terminal domain-containing protein [Natrinema sp. SYSU A 869]
MVPLTALFPMQAAAGGILLIGLLLFILQIVALVWVYGDAQTNSPHSAVLWTLVVFFGGFLGLLLYVLIGRGEQRGRSSHQTQF